MQERQRLLQTIALAAGKMHQPDNVQFGVLTNHPDEWSGMENIPNNVGVFPLYNQSAEDFILSLASWAHGNKTSHQSVLLLLDDLEAASNLDFDARQNLRWLLLRGPARRVWPIITSQSESDGKYSALAGCISYPRILVRCKIRSISANWTLISAELESLNSGSHFTLQEGDHWLRFWLPSIDY